MADFVFARALCTLLLLQMSLLELVYSLSSLHIVEDCPRIRRAVHLLSESELLLYVEGLHAIRANGKYEVIVAAHSEHGEIHHGSSSFFYHSYYVWEVETQIRALGAKFECFSMPYYDYTVDARNERRPMILDSVFGGDGSESPIHCVEGRWDSASWPLRESKLCAATESAESEFGCCLKRNLFDAIALSDAVAMAQILESASFREMSGAVGVEHLKVHQLFGGGNAIDGECAECAMATEFSADDPIFMILHAFTAYLRALWSSCHGYDRIDAAELDAHPNAYSAQCIRGYEAQCGVIELDDAYEFEAMADAKWSLTATQKITPRSMWNFSEWNVAYEHGTFVLKSDIESSRVCDRKNIEQSEWFTRSRRTVEQIQRIIDERDAEIDAAENCTNNKTNSNSNANPNEKSAIESPAFEIAVLGMVLLTMGALVAFKVFRVSSDENEHKYDLLHSEREDAYGTISAL